MKKIVTVLLGICIILGSLFGLQALFMPKYMSSVFEGNLTGDYYKSQKDHDVLILGDCETYENISPVSMWKDYGLKTYIRGNAQQLAWHSYYMLEDTLRKETPKVVVYSVMALRHGERMSEAYNRMVFDDMELSSTKLNGIKASMTEGESVWDYIFPLFRYHTRWSSLEKDDFTYLLKSKKQTSHNGYLMNVGVKAMDKVPEPEPLKESEKTFPQSSMEYLDKMRELCEDKGIKFVLMKAPTVYPHWYEEWDQQMVDYAKKYDLVYINFLKDASKAGLDYSKDTYDKGLHMNVYGAEKDGSYLGKILTESFDLKGHKDDKASKEVWDSIVEKYEAMKEDQKYELKTYGYLKSYGGTPPTN